MTLEETAVIMDILSAAYPAFYSKQTDREKTNAVKLWATMFADDDTRLVAAAVKTLIATKADGFPPSIGEVKDKLHELSEPDEMPDATAWAIVSKAVASTDFMNPSRTFDKLPPDIQAAVGSPNILREWGMVDVDTFQTVIMSTFLKCYRIRKKRQRDTALIPSNVRELLAGVTKKMEIGAGENA